MKTFTFSSLPDFIEKFDLGDYGNNDIFVLDIDGVFFSSIFSWRAILGLISKGKLNAFSEILETNASCTIFTNRWNIFKFFPFVRQISKVLEKYSGIRAPIYENSSNVKFPLPKYSIILNADKPREASKNFIKNIINDFQKVVYISAQDIPMRYNDMQMLSEISKEINTDKLIFIDIKK